MNDLGRDVRLIGCDLPVEAPTTAYRGVVRELANDTNAVGAVITSHKVAVLRAAGDLIGSLDALASECGEVNALRRVASTLSGFARDPVSVGRVVDEIWPHGDQVVCLERAAAPSRSAVICCPARFRQRG
jgi:shikimate dehydrogenase